MRSWLLILTAATLNLRFLLAAPVFERRRTGISPQGAARDKSLLAGNNVLPFIGGLAVGGTVGYFVGARQSRRKINNRQRQTSRNSASNRPTTAGIERIKKKELETRIREYLQSDHYGLDWAYECRTLRNPGSGWGIVEHTALEECFEEYIRLKREANGEPVRPPTKAISPPTQEEDVSESNILSEFGKGEDVQQGDILNEFGMVDLKNDRKTTNSQPKQSFRNFIPSINVGKLNWDAVGASGLRQLQRTPGFVPKGTRPMLHPA